MKRNNVSLIIFVVLFQLTILAQKKEIVAYYPEWGPALRNYYVKNIVTSGSANKITVLNYAFVEPGPDSSGNITAKFMNPYLDYQQVYSADSSVDGVADDSTQPLRGQFNQLRILKTKYPGLKIVISIGGWTGSALFSDAALTSESREKFVNDCIDKFIYGNLPKRNNVGGNGVAAGIFDGFDIDCHLRGHLLAHPRRRGTRRRRRGIAAERIRHRGAPRVATILVKPRTIQQLAPIAIPQHQFRHSRHHEFHVADPRARVHRRLPRGRDAHRSRRLVHPNFQTLYVETRRIEPSRPDERRWQTAVARRERVAAAQRGDPEIQPYARATFALLTARRGELRHVAQK